MHLMKLAAGHIRRRKATIGVRHILDAKIAWDCCVQGCAVIADPKAFDLLGRNFFYYMMKGGFYEHRIIRIVTTTLVDGTRATHGGRNMRWSGHCSLTAQP